MLDKESTFNGLQSLIPTALTMSLAGYHFILPSIIGGNSLHHITEELFIRWLQAYTFLPSMQFSILPWNNFNESTVNLTKKIVNLHGEHAQTLITLAKEAVKSGQPIIRPMWMAEPNDARSYRIDDQFMVGDAILVAPIVVQGQRERSVYLPSGNWADQHGKNFKGPNLIKVLAPLEELPYFKKNIN